MDCWKVHIIDWPWELPRKYRFLEIIEAHGLELISEVHQELTRCRRIHRQGTPDTRIRYVLVRLILISSNAGYIWFPRFPQVLTDEVLKLSSCERLISFSSKEVFFNDEIIGQFFIRCGVFKVNVEEE
jgi:hypothetical protein